MNHTRIAGRLPGVLIFLIGSWFVSGLQTLPVRSAFQAQSSATPSQTVEILPQAAILSPVAGQALQGSVLVTVFSAVGGFQAAELSFAFHDQTQKTWFLIAESSTPISGTLLATWDTTTITDGVYDLRLVVALLDGSQTTAVVEAVRVRNYTPVETDTPTPEPTLRPGETRAPTPAPSATITPIQPTFTPLPPNPAQLSPDEWTDSLRKGGLATGSAFALAGLYVLARKLRKQS